MEGKTRFQLEKRGFLPNKSPSPSIFSLPRFFHFLISSIHLPTSPLRHAMSQIKYPHFRIFLANAIKYPSTEFRFKLTGHLIDDE